MNSSSVLRAVVLGVAVLSVTLVVGAGTALAETLFTTQDDFTGWGGGGFIIGPQASPDTDGSTTNGLGNTTNAGGTGTAGSLSVDRDTAGAFSYFFSQGEQGNSDFLSSLGLSGEICFDFTYPTDGSYFQLGVVMNYDGHFDQYFGGAPTDNGDGSFTQTVPYAFTPAHVSTYMQLGLIFNSDSTTPFTVDNIRVKNVETPEPASLVLVGLGACGLLLWRRNRG